MSIRPDWVNPELPARVPEGFEATQGHISRAGMDKLTSFGAITMRAIEEARWLSTRTDGHTATAPFNNRTSDIAAMMYPEDESGKLGPNFWFWSSLVDTTSKVVEGGLVLPDSLQADQVEDWLTYITLNRTAWRHARWEEGVRSA